MRRAASVLFASLVALLVATGAQVLLDVARADHRGGPSDFELRFDTTADGPRIARAGKAVRGFYVAGADRRWMAAEVRLDGDRIRSADSRRRARASRAPWRSLLVLIGESDDWTPAAPCEALADAVRGRGGPMEIVTYPGTYHDFDNPGITRQHVRTEVPNGVHPGQGVTTAPNAEAREDAKRRVLGFLQEMTGPPRSASSTS